MLAIFNRTGHRPVQPPAKPAPLVQSVRLAVPATPDQAASQLYQARRQAFCDDSPTELASLWEPTPPAITVPLPTGYDSPETYATDLAKLRLPDSAAVNCTGYFNANAVSHVFAQRGYQMATVTTGVGASANGLIVEVYDHIDGQWRLGYVYSLPLH
jgi:hypothetical protein